MDATIKFNDGFKNAPCIQNGSQTEFCHASNTQARDTG
jgi:hypothetical protein